MFLFLVLFSLYISGHKIQTKEKKKVVIGVRLGVTLAKTVVLSLFAELRVRVWRLGLWWVWVVWEDQLVRD